MLVMPKFPELLILMIIIFMLTVLPSVSITQLTDASESSKTLFFFYTLLLLSGIAIVYLPKIISLPVQLKNPDILLLILALYITFNHYLTPAFPGFSVPFYELTGLSLFYLIIRSFEVKYYAHFLLSILYGAVVQVIHGLLQLWGILLSHHPDLAITGNFFNSGPYAGFLAISGVLALGMHLNRNYFSTLALPEKQFISSKAAHFTHLLFQYTPLICLISVLIMLPALRSRAAWIGFASGALVILYDKYYKKHFMIKMTNLANRLIIPLLFIIISAGVYGLYQYKKDSADGRLLIYKVTTELVKEHPLTGLGFDGFKAHYMNAQAFWFKKAGEKASGSALADNTYYAFNEPLQFVAENGAFGLLIACMIIIGYLYLKTTEEYRMIKMLCLALLLTSLVFGSFTYLSGILPVKIIIVLCLALLAKIGNTSVLSIKNLPLSAGRLRSAKLVLGLIGLAVISFGFYKTTRLQNAFRNWYLAQEKYKTGRYDSSLPFFKNASPVLHDYGDYLMQYGKALTMAGQYKPAVAILKQSKLYLNTTVTETALGDAYKALGNFGAAEQAYLQASYMIPSRFYPNYLLVKLYEASNQQHKARKKAMEIILKEIKVPSTAINEMKDEMNMVIAKYEKELINQNVYP